ncbi:hypothetical protein [Streptomyces sp. Mg1]|uniref:hypothetical protein n=1 Tax=Streptomyces sp. Mg1 TaxID=465541 RepID=UPI00017EA042|nr:hypothetical protein [Streptomyces sp. Mg1]EDX20976.1 hypothetical protein SSAG_00767 [Streptomyces sp. Mg1]
MRRRANAASRRLTPAIEASMAAAAQTLGAMRDRAAQPPTVHLGMPDFRRDAGRTSAEPER